MQSNVKISFIGGGNMAQALIGGLVDKLTPAKQIHVVDIHADTLSQVQQKWGVTCAPEIDASVAASEVIVLAVKPQQMREVVLKLQPWLGSQLLISIAAGIRAADLSRWLNGYGAIVRTMPNTPALIGRGITGAVALAGVSATQRELADAILCAVGETVWLEQEAQLDAVTAISGSGPAYVFYFIEAMQAAALELGLSAEQGRQLAQATFAGATELASRSEDSIALLRERVTSKGGTTFAALTSMQADGVHAAIVKALHAAAQRGHAMGEEFGRD